MVRCLAGRSWVGGGFSEMALVVLKLSEIGVGFDCFVDPMFLIYIGRKCGGKIFTF